ncbi:MAG: glycosyltransferase, partial [Planctomycetota bacterium]
MNDSRRNGQDAPPRIVAVVLNWNGGLINRTCLDALLDCTYPSFEILFVDNGSTDGSADDVRKRYPQIEMLLTGENLGFTGGNNRGITRALEMGAEMILLLNNDVTAPRDFLEPLVALLQERAGLAGPKMLDSTGKVWCAGGELVF